MSVPAEVIRTHVRYSAWASQRLVAAASTLTPEQLTRDFGTSDKSVLGTLAHVHAADRAWFGRIHGTPPAVFFDPAADLHLEVLQRDWPALLGRWVGWADGLADSSASVVYQDLQGRTHSTPLWQIVLHLVNHATHHRGQVAGMLRAMGQPPPPLDLIRYYRET